MDRLRRALRGEDLPIGEALHPVTLLAIAVLLLNDWVLKPRFRGSFVTGKLSDVAGLVFAPVVLTAVIGLVLRKPLTHRRLVLACAATAIGFSLTKLVPPVGDVVSRMVGHGASFYPDWTDVLCTPFVLVAYWIGRDELRLLSRPTAAPADHP
ncbi:MAG: hypothetical protein QM831_23205 [Kofleriaceae bacterium]